MRLIDQQTIAVEDVPCELHLGVSEAERSRPQTVRVSVRLTIPEPVRFAAHDRLSETVDYDAIIAFLRHELPGRGEVQLIETVGDVVAEFVLSLSAKIACVEVGVEKPSVLHGAGVVRTTIRRFGDRLTHRHAVTLAELGERQL